MATVTAIELWTAMTTMAATELPSNIIDAELRFLRQRVKSILGRHIYKTDKELSDHDFVNAIFARYYRERDKPLIDPAE